MSIGFLICIIGGLLSVIVHAKSELDQTKTSYKNLFDRTKEYLNPSEVADWEPEE